jgi:pyruvate/2-oxoglutarate/acetoin dehydrogenase E1 component
MDMRAAINQTLAQEMERDDSVILFGEDVAAPGGVFAVTAGLQERFGADRVFDTPISELALSGAAFGSAACGLRPIVEIMFGDFLPLAMDALVNQAAKYHYLSNETACAPLVVRSAVGGGGRFGAIHSQTPVSWFMNVPGLKIVAPSDAGDAAALLAAAIRDDNPVLFLEHKRLYNVRSQVVPQSPLEPLGKARIVRQGGDVTLVSAMKGVGDCLEAARILARVGIEAEVIDVRCFRPLDVDTLTASLARTHRLITVEEGSRHGGWGAEVLARVAETSLCDADVLGRITGAEHPLPYSPPLEDAYIPSPHVVAAEVARLLGVALEPAHAAGELS